MMCATSTRSTSCGSRPPATVSSAVIAFLLINPITTTSIITNLGKRNELIHILFADEQCTLAMKKSVHVLSEVVENYGFCMVDYNTYNARLVVCRNEDGVASPSSSNNSA